MRADTGAAHQASDRTAGPADTLPRGTFVAVEGPTGVGKTTLATRLAYELDAVVLLDPKVEHCPARRTHHLPAILTWHPSPLAPAHRPWTSLRPSTVTPMAA
jgi:hypothetical protein